MLPGPEIPSEGIPRRPNIVLIMADDMGFSDISCFGSEIETPNLDRLAADGLRLTQLYNNARCCPTRASLLTGISPHRAGVGWMTPDLDLDGYRGFLDDRCVTIAEVLHQTGYRTFMSGKWHVGGYYGNDPRGWRPGSPGFPTPLQRGFDHHYGPLGAAGSYFQPTTLARDDALEQSPRDYYLTDAITDDAVTAIRAAAAGDRPFFLYVAHGAPHWPLHAHRRDVERFRGRYHAGWDQLRAHRYERLVGLGLIDDTWELSDREEDTPPWVKAPRPDWEDARMAVYAAQVHRMDRGIGHIMDALEDHGIEDDTLVMFLSDNGGCEELLHEDGFLDRSTSGCPPSTRDGRKVTFGNIPGVVPGSEDTYMSYGRAWANASNTPFRRFKHWLHEGGIATPFVAHWPSVIPGGRVSHEPCHVVDIAATCLDVADADYPDARGDRSVWPLEGESLLALLRGVAWSRQEPIYWEHEGNRAVRFRNWKLVTDYPGSWELYDMRHDRTELHDLSGHRPEQVEELAGLWHRWANRSGVEPWERVSESASAWVRDLRSA